MPPQPPIPTPHYLIHIPPDPHPHHTTLPFLASAFTSWSYRVDTLPATFPTLTQHLKRAHHELLCGRARPSPLHLWALEVARRGEAEAEEIPSRKDSLEAIMSDFILGLLSHDNPPTPATHRPSPSHPPTSPPALTLYTSLIHNIRTTSNAAHPRLGLYARNETLQAIAFDIGPHHARRKEQIWGAVRYAVGRMGEVGKRRGEGWRGDWPVGVRFWVVGGGEGEGEEESPGYERGMEEGEEPPAYDEVVVREDEG